MSYFAEILAFVGEKKKKKKKKKNTIYLVTKKVGVGDIFNRGSMYTRQIFNKLFYITLAI